MDRNEGEDAFAAEIHQRLLAGDPVASADLCAHYLLPLFRQLRSKWPSIDEDFVQEAIDDALFEYIRQPSQFDPSRSSLNGYLHMVAQRDLSNTYRQEKRYRANIVAFPSVGNEDEPGNTEIGRTEDFAEGLIDELTAEEIDAGALALCETEEEQIVARLMLQQERHTAVFAEALGLTGLPLRDQQEHVFRIKDRIMKRWARARGDMHHV